MAGAAVTGAFVMMAVGAYYLLSKQHDEQSKIFLRVGVISGFLFTLLVIGPTGDGQGRNLVKYQPTTLAAMEATFETKQGADLVILGQPNVEQKKIDNPLVLPKVLSLLALRDWNGEDARAGFLPRVRLALEHSIALLQLPHHGRPGDDLHG
jgi:cytochrome d ubiquinol oxidase subunit I